MTIKQNNNSGILKWVLNNTTIFMQYNEIDKFFGGFSIKKECVSRIHKDIVVTH